MIDCTLARRDLLRSLGVGLACLPLLRSGRARAAAGAAPKRLMVLQMSEGLRQSQWKPAAGALAGQTLPYTSAPFEPHKADMIFLPNLSYPGIGVDGHGDYGIVYYGLDQFTGSGAYKGPGGKTFDQVIADALPAPASGRRSLHLHVQLERAPRSTTKPGGSRCFWRGANQPINPVGDPHAIYGEIFAGGAPAGPASGPDPAVVRLMNKRKSILDYVGRSLESFRLRLGTEDRAAVSAHFQSIRDLEKQLQAATQPAPQAAGGTCRTTVAPMIDLDDGARYPDILKAQQALMLDALKCGITSVATLQTGDSSGNNINFAFVPGLPARGTGYKSPYRNWHDLGHNPVMDGVDHKRIVDRWFMEQWAALIQKMKEIPEEGGSLFSNTLVLIGNCTQEGDNHDAQRIPWMLAGSLGGQLATGQCLPSDGKHLNTVLSAICAAFAVPSPYPAPMPGLRKA